MLVGGCTKVVDYFSTDDAQPYVPPAPAKQEPKNETPPPAEACDLCPTDTIYYMGDGKLCSDKACSCSNQADYTCDIDKNLYVQFRIDNAGDQEMQLVTPALFCANNGVYIKTYGGLWLLVDYKDITFPKQRVYVSRMFPGGFAAFNFEFKLADFSAVNEMSCKYDVSARIDGEEQAIDHQEFSLNLTK